jgi:hypothetical protein
MPSGIFGATLTTLTNGTTANASDVMASLNSIVASGLNNDSASLQTDGSGHIIGPNGQIRVIVFITPVGILSSLAFTSGQVQTFTAWGQTGIPASGPIAVFGTGLFTSSTTGTNVSFYPNGGTSGSYGVVGNMQVASSFCNGFVLVPLDGTGKFQVKSNSGASTTSFNCYGYII